MEEDLTKFGSAREATLAKWDKVTSGKEVVSSKSGGRRYAIYELTEQTAAQTLPAAPATGADARGFQSRRERVDSELQAVVEAIRAGHDTTSRIREQLGLEYTTVTRRINALLKAARDAGWSPYIYCAYRPYLTQKQQYEDQVSENMRKGDTRDEAETAAARIAAPPGTSDHQTGLGADIVDQYYSSLSVDTVNARFLTWLADNCADYGFVIRYPSDKVSITGRNEPWHVRYVGDAAAQFMTEHNLCLEEFVALYQ